MKYLRKCCMILMSGICAIWSATGPAFAEVTISGIELEGAKRTDPEWLRSYLGLSFPTVVADDICDLIRKKLMTTDVFIGVESELRDSEVVGQKKLLIRLNEKWTTIPVIRGAFGGGTPMTVLGVYDTHSFGRLWTLGAETRRYGDAPSSYVVWARAPRWQRGRHYLNLELWQLNRIRSIYDSSDHKTGEIRSDASIMRMSFLHPLFDPAGISQSEFTLQAGIDIKVQSQAGTSFTPDRQYPGAVAPSQIELSDQRSIERSFMPTILFDNIEIDGSRMSGIRAILQNGIVTDSQVHHRKFETEIFGFYPLASKTVIATRILAGATSNKSMHNQYFLGGFDTVRGIPDGAVVGSHAGFLNLELRHELIQYKYTHVSGTLFTDAGAAAADWSDLNEGSRQSVGVGFRVNIPQVYRLQFRLDYAMAVDGSSARGVSFGLNQFFQPYRPL